MSVKKIAVLGTGKTGSEVIAALNAKSQYEIISLNRSNPPTEELWKSIDAAICFLPGPAFLEYFDLLVSNPKPMVVGSTGFELSPNQKTKIAALKCPWVMSSNFSLGMALAKSVITQMSTWAQKSGLSITHAIEETHHVHKKDAPSGTALLWKHWVVESIKATEATQPSPAQIQIQSHRVEDLCGLHEYRLELPQETMKFIHDATSRAVFAEGAVWSLERILKPGFSKHGKIDFFTLIEDSMKEGNPS